MLCRRRCCRGIQRDNIDIKELQEKVLQGAILIDVRSNQEYKEGHLRGAVNIPDFEITKRIEKEISKKNQLIILYCQYGGRSRSALNQMRQLGYTNLYNLYGGLDML